ncbi:hypothetical protein CBR_g36908 [Chara braunii]|uniref:Uncharacterized protein n=1 Tax=Chara braunii TaxID=69332 RepID=A0A388JZA7_CHABU|nr:hypothetical protein CBR_g36908 [Chara braunii]|eukprot:GBG63139.1 hypothetical protein CBR_g36908 [Chara braunii]
MSKGNKTIYPDNVANTSARGELHMPRSPSVAGESAAGGDGGDGNDNDGGSGREFGFSAGSTGGNCKRKNMRQQTFEAIAEVMDKHGALMADTVEGASKRQCSILERQYDILEPVTVVAKAGRGDKTPVQAVRSPRVDPSNTVAGSLGRVLLNQVPNVSSGAVHDAANTGWERREEGTREDAGRKEQTTDRTPAAAAATDEPLAKWNKRSRQEDDLDTKSKLWTDEKSFWGAGPGCLIADTVHSCADYYYAIDDREW